MSSQKSLTTDKEEKIGVEIETKSIIVKPRTSNHVLLEDIFSQCSKFRSWEAKEFIWLGNDRKKLKIVFEIKTCKI